MKIRKRLPSEARQLTELWKRSVEKTHTFITSSDIAKMYASVEKHIEKCDVYVAFEDNKPLGFIGVLGDNIDMLFVDADQIGRGIGSKLMDYALQQHPNIKTLEVNEDNPNARAFYEAKGFEVTDRSALDDAGRPFPILHMKRRMPGN